MGNMWKTPLSELIGQYSEETHPLCRPLTKGGPFQLAQEQGLEPEEGYIDECHFCYAARRALVDRFPQYLGPKQVYGLE
jgi:hypothetical protein